MKGNIIYKKTIPARSPEYAEFPKSLHPDIQDFLSGQNIKSLYTHQAEAFSHAMAGENIVIPHLPPVVNPCAFICRWFRKS